MPVIDQTTPSKFTPNDIGNPKTKGFSGNIWRMRLLFLTLLGILFLYGTTSAETKGSEIVSPDSQARQNSEVRRGNFKISVNVDLVTTDVRVIGRNL